MCSDSSTVKRIRLPKLPPSWAGANLPPMGLSVSTHSLRNTWRALTWTPRSMRNTFLHLHEAWHPPGITSDHPPLARRYFNPLVASLHTSLIVLRLPSLMSFRDDPFPLPHGTRAKRPPLRAVHARRPVKFSEGGDHLLHTLLSAAPRPLAWLEFSVSPPVRSWSLVLVCSPAWLLPAVLTMVASSNSTSSPNPPPSLELEIRRLKRSLSAQRNFLLRLDGEGGSEARNGGRRPHPAQGGSGRSSYPHNTANQQQNSGIRGTNWKAGTPSSRIESSIQSRSECVTKCRLHHSRSEGLI
jgi:hypothetical protein